MGRTGILCKVYYFMFFIEPMKNVSSSAQNSWLRAILNETEDAASFVMHLTCFHAWDQLLFTYKASVETCMPMKWLKYN